MHTNPLRNYDYFPIFHFSLLTFVNSNSLPWEFFQGIYRISQAKMSIFQPTSIRMSTGYKKFTQF